MKVAEVMSYRPVTISAFDTVQAAAQLMRAHVIGVLPVLEQGELVGVVTDRDLVVRCIALGEGPGTSVREVMTEEPATCRPEDPLAAAIERMIAARVRRLIVIDDAGVAGMLSIDDLVLVDEARPMAFRVLQQVAAVRGELDGTLAEPWM